MLLRGLLQHEHIKSICGNALRKHETHTEIMFGPQRENCVGISSKFCNNPQKILIGFTRIARDFA